MPVRRRRWPALLAAVMATSSASAPADLGRPIAAPPGAVDLPTASGARIRRLHLVRPDLLPFPIEVDVYA